MQLIAQLDCSRNVKTYIQIYIKIHNDVVNQLF